MMKYPPLLLKHLKMFQEDPKSKIFAPLAESYRKIGLVDEAIEICREGLLANPDFNGGKVALARAYFDKQAYGEVRKLLEPIIHKMPDNLIAQRLLADSYLQLKEFKQALESYKLLLYFNPQDHEISQVVQEMETQVYEAGALQIKKEAQRPARLRKLQQLLGKVQKYAEENSEKSRLSL